jgi:hypothetical protein
MASFTVYYIFYIIEFASCLMCLKVEMIVRWLIDISSSSPMAKRPHDFPPMMAVKVRRQKGVRIRTITVPDSDDENPPPNIGVEFARSVKTRVSTAGKAESVTMKAVRIFEAKDVRQDNLEPLVHDHEEVIAEDPIPTKKARKQRTKKNDSVRPFVFTQHFYTNGQRVSRPRCKPG